MINRIFDNFDKKTISVKKSSTFPRPNFFLFFIITKCACFAIWTSFALKIIFSSLVPSFDQQGGEPHKTVTLYHTISVVYTVAPWCR